MSTGFDPYHAWLGNPPGSPPSNHYELLGLKLFQSEPPIIADAADERIAKAQAQLGGAHAAVAKQLVQELTAARAALLAPASKRAYDADLRAKLGMPPAPEARPSAAKAARPSAPTVVMPQPVAAASAPTVAMPQAAAAVPRAVAPMPGAPLAAVPMAAVPAAMPAPAVPVAMPHAGPVIAQAVPMMAPGVAQATPVMHGYAPAMAQAALAVGYGAPASDDGLEDLADRRRRRRRNSSGQMLAVAVVLVVVGAFGGFCFMYRDALLAALENKPQTVIVQDDQKAAAPEAKNAQPRPEQPKAKTPPAVKEPPKQSPDIQFASNMPVGPMVEPPKRVQPKRPPVLPQRKAPPPAMSVSIKPLSAEEKASVEKSLAGARAALAERNTGKVEEQLNLATLEASSAESLAAINRMRSLEESYQAFWHAVRESVKGLKAVDEIEVDGKKMVVIDADGEHLSVRADGQSRDYKIEKLPTNMALSLAEQWLRQGDPSSNVVLGAFLAVDPKGDRQRARQLWKEAAGQGSEVAKILLQQDAEQG
jgi:hypothetical protein